MSTNDTEQNLGFGCFPLIATFALVIGCIITYPLAKHPPVDYFRLLWIVAISTLLLFALSPWFKSLLVRLPSVSLIFWILPDIYLISQAIYPLVTHFPIDYWTLFWYIVGFAFLLFIQFRLLGGVIQFWRLSGRPTDVQETIVREVEQIDQNQDSASTTEKPIAHFYFFGSIVRIHYYKFGKSGSVITLSS